MTKGDWRAVAEGLRPYVRHLPACKALLNPRWLCTCELAGWLARAEELRTQGARVREQKQAARTLRQPVEG